MLQLEAGDETTVVLSLRMQPPAPELTRLFFFFHVRVCARPYPTATPQTRTRTVFSGRSRPRQCCTQNAISVRRDRDSNDNRRSKIQRDALGWRGSIPTPRRDSAAADGSSRAGKSRMGLLPCTSPGFCVLKAQKRKARLLQYQVPDLSLFSQDFETNYYPWVVLHTHA